MTQEQRDRLTVLRAKLKAREGQRGWQQSVEAIRREIAEIENAG